MSLFAELKRRNVIRVGTAYAVIAWAVVQVAETVFPFIGFSDTAIRNVIVVLAIGFIPSLFLAWVFQFTPQGLRRDSGEIQSDAKTTRLLDRAIIIVLVLGISYFAFDKFVLAPERATIRDAVVAQDTETRVRTGFYGDRSIAVLPFENLSSDPEQRYLGDGIAEEVLNLLARVRKLRVISRSSAFALRDQNLEVPEIAERLDVAHILEGSIRKAGNRARVTVQLIEARTDTHLWSHTYERELDDVFQIQDDIAKDVVANLQIELLSELPKIRHIDPEVLALTAQSYQLSQARSNRYGSNVFALQSRALEIDPDYIPAINMMVVAYWGLGEESVLSWEESQRKIDEVYDRILELDPDSALPDFYYAFRMAAENKLEESAALYSKALEKDLTVPDNVRLAGYFAMHIGKLDAATQLLKHALAVEPLCHQCRRRYAESLLYAGDYETAQREFERYLAASYDGWDNYAWVLLLQGKAREALEFVDTVDVDASGNDQDNERADLNVQEIRVVAQFSLGDITTAEREFEDLLALQLDDQRSHMFSVTRAAAWMGKTDLAFDKLFAMAETEFQYLRRTTFSPVWQKLHDDPRWLEYREFNGTSPERLDAIEFDPDLPE